MKITIHQINQPQIVYIDCTYIYQGNFLIVKSAIGIHIPFDLATISSFIIE